MKRILIIAGSDSGGGAGIQADIKTATTLGAFATTAITAVTAQNTQGVTAIHHIPPDIITAQINAVINDIGVDVVKTGMLGNIETINVVASALDKLNASIPVIIDPVLVATSGDVLLEADAISTLTSELFPRATLLTPNIPEAETLLGLTVAQEDMEAAAKKLLDLGPQAILLKGGHIKGNQLRDVLVTPTSQHVFEDEKIDTTNTHGTGCTLATAIAVNLAQGFPLKKAVAEARHYVREAIRTAPGFGQEGGHGPLNHMHKKK